MWPLLRGPRLSHHADKRGAKPVHLPEVSRHAAHQQRHRARHTGRSRPAAQVSGTSLSAPEGMHVFSVIQSFNSTCRKLGLVPWMCVEKIAENPNYNIFEAGPEMARAPAPPADAPEPDTLYVDQALVAHPAVGESAAETERPPAGAPATPHTPAGDRAGTETGPHGLVPPAGGRPAVRQPRRNELRSGGHKDPSFFKRNVLQIGRRNDGSMWPPLCVPPLPRTITIPDHVPFHGRPPPAVSA